MVQKKKQSVRMRSGHKPPTKRADKGEKTSEHPPIPPNVPPSETHPKHRCKPDQTPSWKLFLEVATFLVLVWYATLTHWQAWSTQEILNVSKKQFMDDERPYVMAAKAFNISIAPLIPATGEVQMVNYGKTPALQVVTFNQAFIGPTALSDAYAFFNFHSPERKEKTNSAASLPPGNPTCTEGSFNCIQVTTTSSNSANDATSVTEIEAHDAGLVMAGIARYHDAYGNPYWTEYCFLRLASSYIASCPEHNEVH